MCEGVYRMVIIKTFVMKYKTLNNKVNLWHFCESVFSPFYFGTNASNITSVGVLQILIKIKYLPPLLIAICLAPYGYCL